MILVALLLFVIVILVLQLISSVESVAEKCEAQPAYVPDSNQRRIRREIDHYISERQRKRDAIETLHRKKQEVRDLEIALMSEQEKKDTRLRLAKRMLAAEHIGDSALANRIKEELSLFGDVSRSQPGDGV